MLKLLLIIALVAPLGFTADLNDVVIKHLLPAIDRCTNQTLTLGQLVLDGFEKPLIAAMKVQQRPWEPLQAVVNQIRGFLLAHAQKMDEAKGSPQLAEAQMKINKLLDYTKKPLDVFTIEDAFIDTHDFQINMEIMSLDITRAVHELTTKIAKSLAHDSLGVFLEPLQTQNWVPNITQNLAPLDAYAFELYHSIFYLLDQHHALFWPIHDIIFYVDNHVLSSIPHPIKKRDDDHDDHDDWEDHDDEDWEDWDDPWAFPENISALEILIADHYSHVCTDYMDQHWAEKATTFALYHASSQAVAQNEHYLMTLMDNLEDVNSTAVQLATAFVKELANQFGTNAYGVFMGYNEANRTAMGKVWADAAGSALGVISDFGVDGVNQVFDQSISAKDPRYEEMMKALNDWELQLFVGKEILRSFMSPMFAALNNTNLA